MEMMHRPKFLIGVLVVIALVAVLALAAPWGQVSLAEEGIFYVDADAGGADDGSSWVDAYTDLQDALDAASAGAQIWVAEGTYTPRWQSDPLDPRTASFQLENEVAIYGGFAGTESNLTDRDWEANPTILSGDLNGDDGPDFANNGENSYHVFYHSAGTDLDGTAVLDSFIITGGNANGGAIYHNRGGGMHNAGDPYNDGSSPTLANCTFSGNWADYGGGMYNYHGSSPTLINSTFSGNWADYGGGMHNWDFSSPTLINCTFLGNSAGYGGGMSNSYDSSPTLTNCTFLGNSATSHGGGMRNWVRSSPTLTDCTFEDNSAGVNGGGMYIYFDSSPVLTNCTFSGNSADYGGGIWNYHYSSPALTNCTIAGNTADYGGGMVIKSNSSPVLTNCTIEGNSAYNRGGGMLIEDNSSPMLTGCTLDGNTALAEGGAMYIYYHASPVMTNCIFEGNSAEKGGGMYNWYYSSPTLTNCTFSSNVASTSGGGMYIYSYSLPTLTNCTFWGNLASNNGGALWNERESSPILANSILWADTPDEIFNYDLDSLPVVTYSDVQGGYAGDGNIDADPSFVNAANGDFHLDPGSPCIDAGNNGAPNLPNYDFEGDDRILDGDGDEIAVVDMGVDEVVYGGSVVVEVEIDVKPTSKSNVINLDSRASLPVAILTTGEFDASTVDPDTVEFAGANVARSAMQDVDRDGDSDLVLYFKIQQLDLDENSKEATLTGETYNGMFIEGTDRVKIR
jgi:parallel beta-helix repeat protein